MSWADRISESTARIAHLQQSICDELQQQYENARSPDIFVAGLVLDAAIALRHCRDQLTAIATQIQEREE